MTPEEREYLTRQVMVSMKVGRVRAAEYVQMIDPLLAEAERRGAAKERERLREIYDLPYTAADRIAQDQP